jgi:hypothetical protein
MRSTYFVSAKKREARTCLLANVVGLSGFGLARPTHIAFYSSRAQNPNKALPSSPPVDLWVPDTIRPLG